MMVVGMGMGMGRRGKGWGDCRNGGTYFPFFCICNCPLFFFFWVERIGRRLLRGGRGGFFDSSSLVVHMGDFLPIAQIVE